MREKERELGRERKRQRETQRERERERDSASTEVHSLYSLNPKPTLRLFFFFSKFETIKPDMNCSFPLKIFGISFCHFFL